MHRRRGHIEVSSAAVGRVQKRCNAMRQRCKNPKDRAYQNYGGRGIRFDFETVSAAIAYVLLHLPHPTYTDVDIDRIDNSGHYAPGNLRLVTRSENLLNTRRNAFLLYNNVRIPRKHVYHVVRALYPEVRYADTVIQNLVSKGLSIDEIHQRWYAPSCKPKGCTILPTPDPDIATLYLGSSSPIVT
jgi:hypothetical protein